MPRRIMRDIETVRLDLDEGDWVDLKKFWTVSDRQIINDALITVKISSIVTKKQQPKKGFRPGHEPGADSDKSASASIDQKMNFYAGQVAALKRGIVAWGGPGFCQVDHTFDGAPMHTENSGECKPIPVTEEAIMGLDDPTSQVIVDYLNELNPSVTDVESDSGEDQEDPLSATAQAS